MPIDNNTKQTIFQIVYDKSFGVLLPEITPDIEQMIGREIERSAQYIENRLRTSLSPARYTDLPKTPEEAYKNRTKYKDAINSNFYDYPRWDDLTPGQKNLYGNNPSLYKNGTLPFELLTNDQLNTWASNVQYSLIKVGDAERQDGRGKAFFNTYYAPIIHVYSVALSMTAPPGYESKPLFFRLYHPSEFKVYHKEGGIHIFPAVMARLMLVGSNDPLYGSQYGPVVPYIPQVLTIDYEFGYTDSTRPFDLLEAVAIRTVMQMILNISAYLTAGLRSYGIEGFNASFGNNGMLYENLYNEYKTRLRELLLPYYRPIMVSW